MYLPRRNKQSSVILAVLLLCCLSFLISQSNGFYSVIAALLSNEKSPALLELHNQTSEKLNFVIDDEAMAIDDIRSMLVGQSADVDAVGVFGEFNLSGNQPTVLIYHTHATEAYTPTEQYSYVSTTEWRTNNEHCSIIAIGNELARILNDEYGICTIHDTSNYEPPKLSTSYSRSELGMLNYKKQYPSLQLYIDIHRDAYDTSSGKSDYVLIDGVPTARMMFVVGTGENYDDKPNFDATFALAEELTGRLAAINEQLVRSIRVKPGRYNQHISDGCMLVEVGHNGNTLEEALNAARLLGQVIAEYANVPHAVSFTP